ncbi:hypothetical protein F383_07221 [Gossypium arboreum]|uniref:Uncharacterized protein n=1 Tax=Gossypium arboreum TaxID=29729 RepID=A0A0B0PVZ3_GOSAR|nr:hypothetical protein F383_07221 [Gossypium arboreum]
MVIAVDSSATKMAATITMGFGSSYKAWSNRRRNR